MTIKECYAEIGGDYESVIGRLRTDDRIVRFLTRVPTDPCFSELEKAMSAGDAATAFRAAHTLKGICLNLSLDRLFVSSNALTDALRGKNEITDEARALYENVSIDYKSTILVISKL